MATAYISFGRGGARGAHGNLSIRDGKPTAAETLTTSASIAVSTTTAPRSGFVAIYCTGNAWVTVEQDPQSATNAGWFLPANSMLEIGCDQGDKVGIIDA